MYDVDVERGWSGCNMSYASESRKNKSLQKSNIENNLAKALLNAHY